MRRDEIFRNTVASIKRNLLSPPRIALPGGRYVRPVGVAAEILKKLKRDAEDGHFHEEVNRVVITCPAEFNVLQRQKVEESARLAGFDEVALLEEPAAGALAYARAGLDVGNHVLVYDLGGGTFDLAVLDNEGESFQVAMEPKGMERCGGEDFDLALYHYCDEVARENLGRPISLSRAVDLTFLGACRRRKESLTYRDRGKFNQYLSSENGPIYFEHEVDRATFEELIGEYVETTTRLTTEILDQAQAAGHEVDTVVLVGGSVRVPLVVRTLEETLPVSPLGFDKRDVAVALGAAHYTNILWGEKPTPKPPRTDAPVTATPPHLQQYRVAVEAVRGKKLNRVEADRLEASADQLGVSREEAREVEVRILGDSKEDLLLRRYHQAVEMAWADGKLSGLEAEWLGALADELGLERHRTSGVESEVMGDVKEAVLGRQIPPTGTSGSRGEVVLAHTLTGHSREVHSVAFSPDGRFLASGASDHVVMGWDVQSGQSVGALAGHTGRVNSVTFSPDGRLIASGGFDRSVRIWKLPNGEPFHKLGHSDWVFCVAIGEDGRLLASGGADAEITLWNLETGEPLRTLGGHTHWVLSVVFFSEGRLLASGGADGTARVRDLGTDETLHIFEHPGWVRSVAVGPDERLLATGGEDGVIRTWSLEDGRLLYAVAGHSGPALSVAVSSDGRQILSGGADGKIKVWNSRTGEPLSILSGHPEGTASVAIGAEGRLLASGGYDRAVKIWRWVSGSAGGGSDAPPSTMSAQVMPPDLPD